MAVTDAVEVAGIQLTSPDRVLYPKQGVTKRELAEYYVRVAEWIVPHLKDRPLTLIRCPRGAERDCFVQRRVSESFPPFVRRIEVEVEGEEEPAAHIMVDTLRGIIYLAQIGVLELHTWNARRDRLDRPDRIILDLDPDPSLPFTSVVAAALRLRRRLRELGLESFVKTTGGKGLHVVAPIARRHGWEEVREFTRALAEEMESRDPDHFLADASRAERPGRIYVDYLRNSWAASAVTSYSPRARAGAPVSVPLAWEELDANLHPSAFTVRTVPARLAERGRDPWEGYGRLRQGLTRSARTALGL